MEQPQPVMYNDFSDYHDVTSKPVKTWNIFVKMSGTVFEIRLVALCSCHIIECNDTPKVNFIKYRHRDVI